ncbi:MAG: SpoIIE family protein phosphatase, partial [Bacteroidales bacterium]
NSGVVRYVRDMPFRTEGFATLVRKVMVNGDSIIYGGDPSTDLQESPVPEDLELPYNRSSIRFEFACLSFDDPASNTYQYILEGFDNQWSRWTDEYVKEYTHLPAGDYRFRVRSRNIYQDIGDEDSFSFSVLTPWYQTWWAFLLYVLSGTGLIYVIILWRTRNLKREKDVLESQVLERTRQIEDQKLEIESQRDEVIRQKDQITDSISYAQRIQNAAMPNERYLDSVMPEYFVMFKPRDIVSGDFYWIKVINNYLIVVAADSTGHGVPGAFMSMLGIALLNEQVGKGQTFQPGEILGKLRDEVKEILVQKGNIGEQKDGMDMAIAIIDNDSNELRYAGANNPLYLVRNKNLFTPHQLEHFAVMNNSGHQLLDLKVDKQPIGIYWQETKFTSRTIKLQDGDTIYLFSDGFVDQKGGPNNKKYLSRNFKRLLLEIQYLSMEEQKLRLQETFDQWKQGNDQMDDLLVIGIRWKKDNLSTFINL